VARALHPRDGSSWEGVGVRPDVECPADQALDRALALVRRD
jgi:C-terminal processing protease CtpA/Prc